MDCGLLQHTHSRLQRQQDQYEPHIQIKAPIGKLNLKFKATNEIRKIRTLTAFSFSTIANFSEPPSAGASIGATQVGTNLLARAWGCFALVDFYKQEKR